MAPSIIMLIRHAEKQPDDPGPPPFGITEDGIANKHSLTVRGWQRAGALVDFFAKPTPPVATPHVIYAAVASTSAEADDEHKSLRPQETVAPLARRLGLTVDSSYPVDQVEALATELRSRTGVVLVAWEHKHIPLIAAALQARTPSTWPDHRFDMVWLLTSREGGYDFTAVNQSLLNGDA
jgi:broad specificity phosphatase PhoE